MKSGDKIFTPTSCSISKSIVSRPRAADSAVARQGEGNNDTIALEMELHRLEPPRISLTDFELLFTST